MSLLRSAFQHSPHRKIYLNLSLLSQPKTKDRSVPFTHLWMFSPRGCWTFLETSFVGILEVQQQQPPRFMNAIDSPVWRTVCYRSGETIQYHNLKATDSNRRPHLFDYNVVFCTLSLTNIAQNTWIKICLKKVHFTFPFNLLVKKAKQNTKKHIKHIYYILYWLPVQFFSQMPGQIFSENQNKKLHFTFLLLFWYYCLSWNAYIHHIYQVSVAKLVISYHIISDCSEVSFQFIFYRGNYEGLYNIHRL